MAANNPTVYPMPPPNADLTTTWAFLEEGVDHIMTKLQTGVSYSKYMALYTVSYNYCTSSKMHGGGGETLGMAGRSKFLDPRTCHAPFRFLPFALLSDRTD
jgi:cullin 1